MLQNVEPYLLLVIISVISLRCICTNLQKQKGNVVLTKKIVFSVLSLLCSSKSTNVLW